MIEKGVKVNFLFNEYKKDKFQKLEEKCEEYFTDNPALTKVTHVSYENLDFFDSFEKNKDRVKNYPSLVLLDQYGVKFLSKEVFEFLGNTEKTDFIYFVSSSYFNRFKNDKNFNNLGLNLDKIKEGGYKNIHKNVVDAIKNKIQLPKLKMYPFSIKKNANIYGIIFGTNHSLAAQKFLEVAWEENSSNGEANYDINEESTKAQLDIFTPPKKTKMELFEEQLRDHLQENRSVSNIDLREFILENGHPLQHGNDIIKQLKKEKLVDFESRAPNILMSGPNKNKKTMIKWIGR